MNVIKILKEKLKKNDILRYKYLKLKEIYMRHKFNTLEKKEDYIKKKFKKCLGYEIDLNKEPETFNQKIQFRKLYDKNPLFSLCADKYRVREYVKEKIGEEYLVPLYLVTDHLTEEQWDSLPNSFVIKTNHDSGTVKVIKDKSKVDKNKIIKIMNEALKIDYGIISMEQYYSDIPRKIIAEKLLINEKNTDIKDYKFFCFNGEVMYCQLIKNRRTNETIDFYDANWNKENFIGLVNPFNPKEKQSNILEKKPLKWMEMKELAKQLSKNFNFVRVDFYFVENSIYFGEMTFCPASGLGTFIPEKWNYNFGKFWKEI